MHYQVQAQVGGKLAQLGGRLIDGIAKKLAEQFFTNFGEIVSEATAESAADSLAPITPDTATRKKKLKGVIWGVGAAILALLIVLLLLLQG